VRWVIKTSNKIVAALLIGALLTVCTLSVLSGHSNNPSEQKASCSSSCNSHGENLTINNLANEEDEDDKEPAPPLAYWMQTPVNLLSLYIMPVIAVLWFISKQRKIPLTSQLRF